MEQHTSFLTATDLNSLRVKERYRQWNRSADHGWAPYCIDCSKWQAFRRPKRGVYTKERTHVAFIISNVTTWVYFRLIAVIVHRLRMHDIKDHSRMVTGFDTSRDRRVRLEPMPDGENYWRRQINTFLPPLLQIRFSQFHRLPYVVPTATSLLPVLISLQSHYLFPGRSQTRRSTIFLKQDLVSIWSMFWIGWANESRDRIYYF